MRIRFKPARGRSSRMLALAGVIAILIAVLAPTIVPSATAYHYDGVAGSRVGALGPPGADEVPPAASSVYEAVALRRLGFSVRDSSLNRDARFATNAADDLARRIADGHAYDKHVIQQGEYPEVASREDFEEIVRDAIENCTDHKNLSGGREAWRSDASDTVVIHDPGNPDGGTAFRPSAGRPYFDGLF